MLLKKEMQIMQRDSRKIQNYNKKAQDHPDQSKRCKSTVRGVTARKIGKTTRTHKKLLNDAKTQI